MQKVEYSFENMYYCKKCGDYTTLSQDRCLNCNAQGIMPFNVMVDRMIKFKNTKEIIFLLSMFLLIPVLGGIIFTITTSDLVIAFLILIVCLASIILIQKKFAKEIKASETLKIIEMEKYRIDKSLEKDFGRINETMADGKYLEAYKMLRQLGTIKKIDSIKKVRVYCLNKFVIRSDMALEMEELLLNYYDKDLVTYIYEVCKIQRNLVKQSTIDYIIKHEEHIQKEFNEANLIFGNIAGAAIYSKSSLEFNKDFVIRHINNIPKDRLTRLERLVERNNRYDWDEIEGALR